MNFSFDDVLPLLSEFSCNIIEALPPIKKVIFNERATVILWDDSTKTVVKCMEGETYDKEKGFVMAVAKKAFGNKDGWYSNIKKWVYKNN